MPVYVVTGKLGSGKTLSMVGRMRDYLERGRPVATNININIRKLVRNKPAQPVLRLPDRPTVEDFLAMGPVHDTGREELNGGVFLDECGTWLNSRSWSDKGRQALIDLLLHSRKLGWDVFFIVQSITLLDKQIRDALAEYVVICRRMDRLKMPFVGRLGSALSFGLWSGNLPKVHVALVRYGMGVGSIHAETWYYKGADLYAAYQTTQVIRDDSPGMHSLVWYATDEERAAWRPLPKPKLELVRWVQRLPVDRRIPAMRRIGLAT